MILGEKRKYLRPILSCVVVSFYSCCTLPILSLLLVSICYSTVSPCHRTYPFASSSHIRRGGAGLSDSFCGFGVARLYISSSTGPEKITKSIRISDERKALVFLPNREIKSGKIIPCFSLRFKSPLHKYKTLSRHVLLNIFGTVDYVYAGRPLFMCLYKSNVGLTATPLIVYSPSRRY